MRSFLQRFFGAKRKSESPRRYRPLLAGAESLEDRRMLAHLTIANEAVDESAGQITFTVTLTGNAGGMFWPSIVIEAKPGATHAATDWNDFNGGQPYVVFVGNDGETFPVVVTINDENRVEYDEEFQVRIAATNMAGVTAGGPATGTIENDDSATIWLIDDIAESASPKVAEGDQPNPGKVTFFVRSSAPIDETLSVDWSTSDGAALAGQDYVAKSGSLAFGLYDEGQFSDDVNFIGDGRVETRFEYFSVALGAISLHGGGVSILPVTVASGGSLFPEIEDEDTAQIALLPIFDATEGTHGSRDVTVELMGDVDTSFSVAVSTAAGTASGGQDYTTLGGHVLTFSGTDGEEEECTLTITNDNLVEAETENLSVYLHDPPNIPAGYAGRILVNPNAASRTVTITDNDVSALTIDNQSAPEEMPGGAMRILSFTVNLTRAFDQGMTLHFDVYGQTANGNDVVGGFGSRSVDIAAGATSVEIQIAIAQDTTFEPNETFVVNLQDLVPTAGSSLRAFSFTDDEGIGTIENND